MEETLQRLVQNMLVTHAQDSMNNEIEVHNFVNLNESRKIGRTKDRQH